MKLLGLDFETTGLDVAKDRIIEIGASVWDTDTNKPIKTFSALIYEDLEVFEISEEITRITGIEPLELEKNGIKPLFGLQAVADLMHECQFVVAHNGKNFDEPLFYNEAERHKIKYPKKHWLDTSVDVVYPASITTKKLTYLAAEHGFLNPFAHRALFDVLTMFEVLKHYDIEKVAKRSMEKDITLRAMVSYDNRELAKARGYRWNGEKKIWYKTVKESDLENELKDAKFKVQQITQWSPDNEPKKQS